MRNRKGATSVLSIVIKIVIILIVFIVLISTFIDIFGRTKKATFDLIDKEYKEFAYLDGSYIHPDLLDSDLSTFWFTGFRNFIREAITSEEPCLGSFYIDDRIDMQDVSISFLQEPTGITMFLRDSKGVVGAFDDKILNNTDGHEWKLCIIDPSRTNFNSFFNEFELSFRLGHPLHVASQQHISWITNLHDIVIDFKGKPKGSDIKVTYFTPAVLNNPDMPPEEADYHAYPVIGTDNKYRGIKLFAGDKIDRYLFFFVVSGDNFCILPTTKENGNSKAFNINRLKELLTKGVFRGRASKTPEEFFEFIDQSHYQTFCKIPGGEESVDTSIFKGYNSCYYYGCDAVGVDNCKNVFEKCKGLCSLRYTNTPWNVRCVSCQEISKCSQYDRRDTPGICRDDLCTLGCTYDIAEKECIVK